MSFYDISEEMGDSLKEILNKISFNHSNFSTQKIAITWINYQENNSSRKGKGFGINNERKIYPASIIKLIYGLAIHSWIEEKRIVYSSQIFDAVYKMLHDSSNDATSFVIDILTGTTSGPSLEGEAWDNWRYQREIINDWLKNFNWDELIGINCCQKTWEDSPYGREKDFYGINNERQNLLTTDSVARFIEEIMQNMIFKENNINLKNCLFRKNNHYLIKQDPNNQIDGFLGGGLPEGYSFWSKAGLMSKVRHDAICWLNKDKTKTLLVVFCEGEVFAENTLFLPELSKNIYELNQIN